MPLILGGKVLILFYKSFNLKTTNIRVRSVLYNRSKPGSKGSKHTDSRDAGFPVKITVFLLRSKDNYEDFWKKNSFFRGLGLVFAGSPRSGHYDQPFCLLFLFRL